MYETLLWRWLCANGLASYNTRIQESRLSRWLYANGLASHASTQLPVCPRYTRPEEKRKLLARMRVKRLQQQSRVDRLPHVCIAAL